MSDKKGKVIVIVAPSGAGKTTIARRILDEFPQVRFSVSATTRPPRKNEVHGKDYYFLTKNDFQDRIDRGEFLEWEEFYNGKRYGSLKEDVENQLNKGYFVLFDVEVKGAHNIKTYFGDRSLTVFIKPPSFEVLRERLMSRGTENEETIAIRLERAKMEMAQQHLFDLVVLNDHLETAYEKVRSAVDHFINTD